MNCATILLTAFGVVMMPWRSAQALSSETGSSTYLRPVKMACDNPQRILQVQSLKDETVVIQSGPAGNLWEVRLPISAGKRQSYLSPDGQAALVITSVTNGRGFLVTGNKRAILIEDAYLHGVDFRGDRALVATTQPVPAQGKTSVRVRVYDLQRGALLGDTRIDDWDSFDTWTLEREWRVKLSEDGNSYFYVREHDLPPGQRPEIVVRDVVSGERSSFPLMGLREARLANVYDAVFPTPDKGYVSTGKNVYAIAEGGLKPVVASASKGGPEKLVYSHDARQLGVSGTGDWGARVYDVGNGAWHLLEQGRGYLPDLKENDAGWTVVDGSARHGGIRQYRVTASGARLVRRLSDARAAHPEVACTNAYGLMRKERDRFRWHPTK